MSMLMMGILMWILALFAVYEAWKPEWTKEPRGTFRVIVNKYSTDKWVYSVQVSTGKRWVSWRVWANKQIPRGHEKIPLDTIFNMNSFSFYTSDGAREAGCQAMHRAQKWKPTDQPKISDHYQIITEKDC